MQTHQIRYFLEVRDSLNFTRAAQRCGVSQPSLSRAIRQLEWEFGGPLFHRERRNTHLTALGHAVAPHLEAAVGRIASARDEAMAFHRSGHAVRLGVTATLGPASFHAVIAEFRRSFPQAELTFVDCAAAAMAEMLKRGELSVGLFTAPWGLDRDLNGVHLFDEPFEVALAADDPLAARESLAARDLGGAAYIKHALCPHAGAIERAFAGAGAALTPTFVSPRTDWLMAMIAGGLGFGLAPRFTAGAPGVVRRPLVEPRIVRSILLVTVRGRPHTPCIGAMAQAARRFMAPAG
jgi:DNA-binding transcriptional LysR family regulator